MQCPKCGSTDQLTLGDGTVLCLDCRHEHDGTTPLTPPQTEVLFTDDDDDTAAEVQAITQAATVDELLAIGVDDERVHDSGYEFGHAEGVPNLAGRFVRIVGGVRVYLVTEDNGNDQVLTLDENDKSEWVDREVLDVIDTDDADPLAPTPGAETVSEDQPFDPAIFAVAGMALTVGAACIGDDGETLYNPRIGWLPPPCNQVPEAEQGVAYAIATLIVTFGLDKGSVEAIAAALMTGAATPELETT